MPPPPEKEEEEGARFAAAFGEPKVHHLDGNNKGGKQNSRALVNFPKFFGSSTSL